MKLSIIFTSISTFKFSGVVYPPKTDFFEELFLAMRQRKPEDFINLKRKRGSPLSVQNKMILIDSLDQEIKFPIKRKKYFIFGHFVEIRKSIYFENFAGVY
ncbi:TPA: hypothetical protein DIC38_02225 [Candidatus Nomurabacteria bacterium]|nr:MAG: hypothetical protein O210_OD1C00001G0286 [Parcubacteria bacterium RAAC4_OD1_1]HCY26472.1 hypothetical protein [Candidatus Nomurabacteria bacterium]